jgi:hypothetical protein
MTDVESVLYREALLDLLRTARAFAQAVVVAVERARRVGEEDPLAEVVAGECRAAITQAVAAAPGLLSLFTKGDTHGLASDAADDVPHGQPTSDQSG